MARKQKKMEEIGIRELKAHVSDVVRAVKEQRARYVITQRGVPVAVIIPMDAMLPEKNNGEALEKMMEIRRKLSKSKQNKKSSVDILSEMRR
ncbi:MAG: type II toxin-antitoxin system Phd/YefM family antitoxin [Anaerolineales bacterium]|nr:type II toxin-antitoxin system Phd/YefM family antitoxin [Anaerolineales bacterium]